MKFKIFMIFIFVGLEGSAQKFKEISIGTNFFETQSFGNNPLTISSLMRDPSQYKNYINNFQHDSWGGTGRFYSLNKAFFINTSIGFINNRKWHNKLLLNLGVSLGFEQSNPTGSLSKRYFNNTNPLLSERVIENLNLFERRNYMGVLLGMTYLFRPYKKVSFFTSIQYLHDIVIIHSYTSSIEKLTFTSNNGAAEIMESVNYENRSWEGKTYSTQRLFIPIGLDIKLYKKYSIRPAIQLGLFWPPKPFKFIDESHGFSIQIVKRI